MTQQVNVNVKMGYVERQLNKAGADISSVQVYWRKQCYNCNDPWLDTSYPDGECFWEIDSYEYIAYDATYVYVWVVYDCYIGSFYRTPRNPQDLTPNYHSVDAG